MPLDNRQLAKIKRLFGGGNSGGSYIDAPIWDTVEETYTVFDGIVGADNGKYFENILENAPRGFAPGDTITATFKNSGHSSYPDVTLTGVAYKKESGETSVHFDDEDAAVQYGCHNECEVGCFENDDGTWTVCANNYFYPVAVVVVNHRGLCNAKSTHEFCVRAYVDFTNDATDIQLLSGDFDTLKSKIMQSVPVEFLEVYRTVDDAVTLTSACCNSVVELAECSDGEEFICARGMLCDYYLYPDNTLEHSL